MEVTNIKQPPQELQKLNSNATLLLNEPNTLWVVQSGAVLLFAITVQDGEIRGIRRYLFTVKPSGIMIGAIANTNGKSRSIIAVALEDTVLVKFTQKALEARLAEAKTETLALVENWVHQLGKFLSNNSTPLIALEVEGRQNLFLTKEQKIKAKRETVIWVEIIQGCVNWRGNPQIPLTNTSKKLPLGEGTWLEAEDSVELQTIGSHLCQSLETLLVGLNHFHQYFFQDINLIEYQELQEEIKRIDSRHEDNSQILYYAQQELASVIIKPDISFTPRETLLLAALGAIGRVMDIKIKPPAIWEDLHRFSELEAIARSSGIRMRQVLLENKWWTKDSGPILAYTYEDKRPVALLPEGRIYKVFDPQDMSQTVIDAQQAALLNPVAYVFYRPFPEKKLNFLDVLKFATKGTLKDILLIISVSLASVLLGMITPQATGFLIENAIPDANQRLLWEIGLGPFATAFGIAAFGISRGFAIARIENIADSSSQTALWDRLLKLSVPFFRQYSIGDLQSRVTAISQMRSILSGTTLQTFIDSLFSVCNLALLFYYSSQLAWLAVAIALVIFLITTFFGVLNLQISRPQQEVQGELVGVVVQLINGVSKLKVGAAEERAFAYWSKKYSQLQKLVLKRQQITDIVQLVNALLSIISTGLLFWVAVWLLEQTQVGDSNKLSIGTFLSFNSAYGTFITGVSNLSNTVTSILIVRTLWRRAEPILKAEPEVNANLADPGKLSGRFSLEHVVFRYQEDGPLILNNVSIYANPGEFIALVGPSGSGKSTVLRLLLRFEFPESGKICYDGHDLAGLNVLAVRRQLGVVMQNGRITAGPLLTNITGGALVTMDEAWEAARMAGLADDIKGMPMGMHTVISEGGTNLSGGQRQRLLIARSLIFKPPILLFDEATSALDNKTQAIVSESLDRLRVTRVIIAHRLSTIRHADRIYVIESGRVVQVGSYEELASQKGLFARLIARQQL